MLPDSHSSVSGRNECTFSTTHCTFPFKSVVKLARSNGIPFFRNVATGTFFQLAWVKINTWKIIALYYNIFIYNLIFGEEMGQWSDQILRKK